MTVRVVAGCGFFSVRLSAGGARVNCPHDVGRGTDAIEQRARTDATCMAAPEAAARQGLTGGQAHDLVGVDHLLPTMQPAILIADNAFDADERVIEPLAAGKAVVVPSRPTPSPIEPYWYPEAKEPRTEVILV